MSKRFQKRCIVKKKKKTSFYPLLFVYENEAIERIRKKKKIRKNRFSKNYLLIYKYYKYCSLYKRYIKDYQDMKVNTYNDI